MIQMLFLQDWFRQIGRKLEDFPCVWWRSVPTRMGEELVLMIVLRSQVVIKFRGMVGSLFIDVPGRPVPVLVILEIVTTKVP